MVVLHRVSQKKHPTDSVSNRYPMLTFGYGDIGSQQVRTRFGSDMESSHRARGQIREEEEESLWGCHFHIYHIFDLTINMSSKYNKGQNIKEDLPLSFG